MVVSHFNFSLIIYVICRQFLLVGLKVLALGGAIVVYLCPQTNKIHLIQFKEMNTNTQAFATLRPQFKLEAAEIEFLQGLPDNMPETKLTKKQIELIGDIYYKYIANKIVRDWWQDLAEFEQKSENWPSGPRIKRHEAQRMILGHLVEFNLYRAEMTAEQAAKKFFNTLTCRESYTILVQKAFQITE